MNEKEFYDISAIKDKPWNTPADFNIMNAFKPADFNRLNDFNKSRSPDSVHQVTKKPLWREYHGVAPKCSMYEEKIQPTNVWIKLHTKKGVVLSYLRITNPVPPGNGPQCGWEGRTGCACWDEALGKQLGMLKRKLQGSCQELDDASQFQSSNISWKQMYMII
jgi:hypothetical protein